MPKKIGKKVSLILKHSMVVIVMVSTALVGVIALRGSYAATGSYVFAEAVEINPATGTIVQHLPNIGVKILVPNCTNYPSMSVVRTGANGIYSFGNCPALEVCLDLDAISESNYYLNSYKVFTAGGITSDQGGGCARTQPDGTITFELKFYRTATPITLNTTSAAITAGGSTTLTWTAPRASYCETDGAWGKAAVAGSGSRVVTPTATSSYSLNCVASGGGYARNGIGANSVTKTVTVSPKPVVQPPSNQNSGAGSSNTGNGSGSGSSASTNKTKTTPAAVAPVVAATSGDTSPPEKPADLVAELNDEATAVSLKWSAAKDNVAIAKYLVERSISAVDWDTISSDSDKLSFTDKKLPSSEEASYVYYRVRAQDAAGNISEAAYADVENIAPDSGSEEETTTPTTTESTTKSSTPLLIKIGGGLLLLATLIGGILWYRRLGSNSEPYVPMPPTTPTVIPNPSDLQPPHATQSLKDMVMHDYHPGQQVNPEQPPRQDPPYPPQQ